MDQERNKQRKRTKNNVKRKTKSTISFIVLLIIIATFFSDGSLESVLEILFYEILISVVVIYMIAKSVWKQRKSGNELGHSSFANDTGDETQYRNIVNGYVGEDNLSTNKKNIWRSIDISQIQRKYEFCNSQKAEEEIRKIPINNEENKKFIKYRSPFETTVKKDVDKNEKIDSEQNKLDRKEIQLELYEEILETHRNPMQTTSEDNPTCSSFEVEISQHVEGMACVKNTEYEYIDNTYKDFFVEENNDEDEFLFKAINFVINKGKAEVLILQENFKVGYEKAIMVLKQMEEWGVVGPADEGSRREILITKEEWEELKA